MRSRFRLLVVAAVAASAMLVGAQAGRTAVVSGTTYQVVNATSGKCVAARGGATANGTAVEQSTCNGGAAQNWVFTATDSGYFQVAAASAATQAWDDTGISSADGSPIQLWSYGGGSNQQWLPVQESNGNYHFVNRFSGKCLDDTNGSTADGTQFQQWACTGGPNQSFKLTTSSQSSITSGTTYTVKNQTSGMCVDARAAGSANDTAVQQYTCNGSGAQSWVFTATDSGYFRVGVSYATGQVWDDSNVSTADGSLIHLWTYGGGANQQWLPVKESNGNYHFVNRFSGKCLDNAGSTALSVQLQQWTCNSGPNQSYTVTAVAAQAGNPDLGPNVKIFDPSMSASSIQSQLDSVFNSQQSNQFGSQRYALLFKPGTYNVTARVGFYTQVSGLGLLPDSTQINGGVTADAQWFKMNSSCTSNCAGNATQNFWRDVENLAVTPNGGTDKWAVSQADPFRRVHVRGAMVLDDNGGWSSGGFFADDLVDGQVNSGTQQQWLSRNSQWGSWTGANWNMVFVGDVNAPGNSFPNPPYTTVGSTPAVREKPFLYVDTSGNWNVFVPAMRTNSSGTSWSSGNPAGTTMPLSQFTIIRPGDTATTMNNALAAGQNLLVTPGVYHLSTPLNITRANTVVLGLGLATIIPDGGVSAINVADVDGVKIAGLLVDAGTTNSSVLVQVGPSGSSADHSANPTELSDLFVRIGGVSNTFTGATQSVVVNSNNVILDHAWLWRADHSNGVGWNTNPAVNGLVVNGQNVTAYGLFVEHYKGYQVIWNGNGGRTYFFQNEMPYDVPDQASWMNGSTRGFAAFKVGSGVTSNQAWGLGSYCFFNTNPSVVADRAFEVPVTAGVQFHDMVTVSLGGTGTIAHIINNTGAAANSSANVQKLVSGP